MSILKQAEEAKLTLEEIQELITLLDEVLPKIEAKAKSISSTDKLVNNLKASFGKTELGASMNLTKTSDDKKDNSILKGFELLKSSKSKLQTFVEVIKDI